MIIHAGARFGLGGGGHCNLICCNECGAVAVEAVAQHGGWGMYVRHRTRHHHCPQHIREDESQWYADNWYDWGWAN